jgi:hypothetical protein
MTHIEVYHRLVCEENRQMLHPLMQDACASIGYKMLDMVICNSDGLQYIECNVDTKEHFHAVMIGFILDIRRIVPESGKDHYYLPSIMFCTTYNYHVNQYLDRENSRRHELMHLRDVLCMIDKDPQFTNKVMQYSMNKQNILVKDLPKSIEFEMYKLFILEPKASREDHKNGENYLLIPLNNGGIYRHGNVSLDEFVRVKIGSEIARIRDIYLEKFPNNPRAKQIILRQMRQSLVRHGKDVFKSDLEKVLRHLQ